MKKHNEMECISQLCLILRQFTTSLDLKTVLRHILEGTRTLTGARNGILVTVDALGTTQEYITLGLDPEEELLLQNNMSEGRRLFEHLCQQEAPVRLEDFPAYVRSLGLTTNLCRCQTFLGMSIHTENGPVGYLFIGDKEGGEGFTREDEELLQILGSQVAAAITNARVHLNEQRLRARFERLAELTPVGVLLFEVQTTAPPLLNPEAQRLVNRLGWLPTPSWTDLVEQLKVSVPDGRTARGDQVSGNETLRNVETTVSVSEGPDLHLLVNMTPIHCDTGKVQSLLVTLQDLAPFEELDRLRVEFLAMVSHELRAPLASIKGSTAMLLNPRYKPDRTEISQFATIIDQGAEHLQGLISNLLDAGRIHAGLLSVDPEAVTVPSLVEQARRLFLSGERPHPLRVNLPLDLPLVMADAERIVQVLHNLLSNAARHSPESSPIEVGAVAEDDAVALWVADQGRGIEPTRLPSLFQRYSTSHGAGFGLGLTIAKGLVEAHGGRIKAESRGLGLGTRFTFTLPRAEGAGPRAEGAGPRAEGAPSLGSIVLVEDDPQMVRFVRDTLTAAGFSTLVTSELDQAAHLVRTEKPHLVLLDLMLPEGDSITFLQEEPGLADLPVIFLSGYGREETIARALEAGAVDYLVKPFSGTELIARVRAARRRRDGAAPFGLGELTIDYDRRLVRVGDRTIELTPIEYDLLRLLSVHAGRVVPFDSLLHKVWGHAEGGNTQAVRNFVKKLRRKLGDDPAAPAFILNVRGVGYRMPGLDEASRARSGAARPRSTE